jgi:multidrug transporter EmrE-like cation transporter
VLVTGSAALLSAAALPFLPFPAAHSWPWLAASVLLQVTYYGLVARCYQQVDMSLAYPLMRGSAPILVALAGTLLGEQLPAAAWLGVVLVSTGILCMALGAWRPAAPAAADRGDDRHLHAGRCAGCAPVRQRAQLHVVVVPAVGHPAAAVGAVHARRRGAGLCAAALAAGTGRWRRHHRLVCDGVVGHDPGAGGNDLGAARIVDPVRAADLGVPAARAVPRTRWLAASLIVGGVLALRLA